MPMLKDVRYWAGNFRLRSWTENWESLKVALQRLFDHVEKITVPHQ